MKHRLDPLLRPGSVAVVGASARVDSIGEWSLANLLRAKYRGTIYAVNPNYEQLQGVHCYARLENLPAVPDLVIFGVGDQRIEAALDDAIAFGVPAAVIMSTLALDDDTSPNLKERVQRKIRDAGMLVCGANGMGFYNVRDHVWACGFDSADHTGPGSVSLISHSGAGMSGLIDCDERLRINFAVSTGNELSVTMDEYLDFALDLPETRAVGLFVESSRNPQGLREALKKAAKRKIPIVALKVGRTEEAARLTVSHSGAMAGNDTAFAALFDRYGVQRVCDMDELATTLIMFDKLYPLGAGGLVTLHDSGGERQLLIDLADQENVPMTKLQPQTVDKLLHILDPESAPVNPLDAWSRGGPNAAEQMTQCLSIMMQDPEAALGGVIHNRAPEGKIYPSYMKYMQRAHAESGKPVALVAARQGTGFDTTVVTSTQDGFPVLDGVVPFLKGVHALISYRDFQLRSPSDSSEQQNVDAALVAKWKDRLKTGEVLDEADSLGMLDDFGLNVINAQVFDTEEAIVKGARITGYPLALKTAMPGMLHKSEQKGVRLNILDESLLRGAYENISARLGARVLLAPMARDGVEMILGAHRDPQFGPVVVLGFGGILAEVIEDVAFALPPFDAAHAKRCLDRLQFRSLLDGVRGKPAVDISAFCDMAAYFSSMIHALGDEIIEADVNPVIVHEIGCTAVDALVIGRSPDTV